MINSILTTHNCHQNSKNPDNDQVTDEYLDKTIKKVADETGEKILLNRFSADKVRERKRDDADDKSSLREHARSDKAQNVESEEESRLLQNQYHSVSVDLESETNPSLFSDEISSHDLTTADLIKRETFLSMVSHDLRNPLTGILIGAGLMRKRLLSKDALDKDALLKYTKLIERSAAYMDRMIYDLLDAERMANNKLVLHPEKICLCALLQEAKELFAPVALNKSFSMTIRPCSEPIYTIVDRDRILQVLSNLIGNALKFTPNGGSIILSVRKQASAVKISVADNGPGIPENHTKLIFEKFSQLNTNDRRGLGLGLFISKLIVEAHKGRISVYSEAGKGTVISFTLPTKLHGAFRKFQLPRRSARPLLRGQ